MASREMQEIGSRWIQTHVCHTFTHTRTHTELLPEERDWGEKTPARSEVWAIPSRLPRFEPSRAGSPAPDRQPGLTSLSPCPSQRAEELGLGPDTSLPHIHLHILTKPSEGPPWGCGGMVSKIARAPPSGLQEETVFPTRCGLRA